MKLKLIFTLFVALLGSAHADNFNPINTPYPQYSIEMDTLFNLYSSGDPNCREYCAPFAETMRFAAIMNRYDFNYSNNSDVRSLWDLYAGEYSNKTTKSLAVVEMANLIGSNCHPENYAGFDIKIVLNQLKVNGRRVVTYQHDNGISRNSFLHNKRDFINHLDSPDQTSTMIIGKMVFKKGPDASNGNPTLIPENGGSGHRVWIRATHEVKRNTIIIVDPTEAPKDRSYVVNELNLIKGHQVDQRSFSTLFLSTKRLTKDQKETFINRTFGSDDEQICWGRTPETRGYAVKCNDPRRLVTVLRVVRDIYSTKVNDYLRREY
tara:strand:- start:11926 stop:12888 length:963 start_codon:yes stop_codon:yes gene_type:complete